MRLTHFGGHALIQDDGDDRFSIEARESLLPLPEGAFDYDGNAYKPLPRSVSRSFTIISTDEQTIRERLDAFLQVVGSGRHVLKGITRDDQYRQTFAKVPNGALQWGKGGLGVQKANCIFSMNYPFWMATDDEPYYLDNGLYLDDGWSLDEGNVQEQSITGTTTGFTVTNSGTMPVRRGVISIVPGASASLTNIRIWNVTTGYEFTWTGTLSDGERLDFDLLTESARQDWSTDTYNNFSTPTKQIGWMQLAVGANTIKVLCDSVSNTTTLYWRFARHYL